MKKIIFITALVFVSLALLLPFASQSPDGLQTMADNHANEQKPFWNGLLTEYSIVLGDPYLSTLATGLFGTGIVLIASFAIGTMTNKRSSKLTKSI